MGKIKIQEAGKKKNCKYARRHDEESKGGFEMDNAYLPNEPSQRKERIQDLLKYRKMTQAELAERIGLSESTLSRYLHGNTEMLGDGYIIRIAKVFDVSTDFLLGETDIPDRKNYDIEELGLTAKSAKLLYTGRIDSKTLNLLLEDPRFPKLLNMLSRYQKEMVKQGIEVMNEQLSFVYSLFLGHAASGADHAADALAAAEDLKEMQTPEINADLTAIQNLFMNIVRGLKERGKEAVDEDAVMATRDGMERMRNELTKGEESLDLNKLTAEDIVDAISMNLIYGGASEETISDFKNTMVRVFNDLKDACHDK